MTDRLVVLLDMDCFYVQVEERHYPHIRGLPAAVVQYNSWKGGGIIAVNYEARAFGVKRGMRGDEARSKCPDIQLVTVPVNRGKADLTRYRDAGKEVINVLCDYSDCVERASIDEAYIDFTGAVQEQIVKHGGVVDLEKLKSTWVVGHDEVTTEMSTEEKEDVRRNGVKDWLSSVFVDQEDSIPLDNSHPEWDNIRLAFTAALCEEMRAAVLERTGFKCSAGIAHNKMLGKLSCGLHKPNQQTVLPQCNVALLWKNMPVGKVRNLGGKLGDSLTEDLGCKTMGDLAQLSLQQLTGRFETKTSEWLYNLGRGIDTEPVTSRQLPKSIGCGKNFQGKEALNTQAKVQKWMLSLAEELTERLNEDQTANKRRAKTLTVGVRLDGDAKFTSLSRSANLSAYCAERIARVAISLIQHTNKAPAKNGLWNPSIKNISLSAAKFEDWTGSGSGDIQEMFKKAVKNPRTSTKVLDFEEKSNGDQDTLLASPVKDTVTSVLKTPNSSLAKNEKLGTSPKVNKGIKSPKESGNSKSSPMVSNSFFKNLLQRRVNKQSTVATDPLPTTSEKCNGTELPEENNDIPEVESTNNHETEGKSDLDLLASLLSDDDGETCLSEDDLPCGQHIKDGGDSDSSSVYDAATDIDSSFSSEYKDRLQGSQDLFVEDDPGLVSRSSENVDQTPKQSGVDAPCCTSKPHMKDVPPRGASPLKSCQESGINHNLKSLGSATKVSVQELFPDLDNVDESILSMLPKELKLEVENALKDYKTKTQQKKSGMWKYVTSVPSPQKTPNSNSSCDLFSNRNGNEAIPGPSKEGISEEISHVHLETPRTGINCIQKMDESNKCTIIFDNNNVGNEGKDFIDCKECGLQISALEVQEHADYHLALSLQSDMKTDANLTNSKVKEKNRKSNRGRKRIKGNVKSLVTVSKMQKLDSFFKS
ncbi:DNA polymerase eta-like [Macrobrachium nipponense]|uniref:DNA polymerase eta-like n=1 Tax=Macrobrachium nipponense TaxID=159736 RepID=UPI0030C85034